MASHSGGVVKSANFAETKIDSGLLHLSNAFLPRLYFPILVANCRFELQLFTQFVLFATWRKAPIMGKWAVSESVWPDNTYEDHCNGWLWITTSKVKTTMMMAAVLRNNEECINENLRGMA